MNGVRRGLACAPVLAGALLCGLTGTSAAAFPNFSDCPRSNPDLNTCIDIQSRSGSIDIKGFSVPIGESLEIRGGLQFTEDGAVFIPPRGTNGFFARAIRVPGGLLGINFPLPGNAVTATATLAGPPSSIRVDLAGLGLALPVKLKLSNPLIGAGCQIASTSNPARLNLITGTTSPPAPNRPISGGFGTIESPDINTTYFRGNTNVDNSFAIPAANGCGYFGLGLIDVMVDLKLGLPSAAGRNAMVIRTDVGLQVPNP